MRPEETETEADGMTSAATVIAGRLSRPAPAGPRATRRRGLASPLAVALVVASSAALAQEPPAPPLRPLDLEPPAPPGPEVTRVTFEGVESLDPDLLENAVATKATRCRSPLFFLFCALGLDFALEERYLDAAALPEDVERTELLYEAWGFPDAEADAVVEWDGRAVVTEAGAPADEGGVAAALPARGEVEVTFRVREGEPIRVASLEVRGLDALDPPVALPSPLPLEAGDPYALPLLDSTQNVIRRAFAERGRPYAQVVAGGDVDEAARAARVVLEVEPGPAVVFGETTVVTEAPIEEEVVRERLAYAPGDPFRPSAIEETQRRLYELPIVERVLVEPVGLEQGDTVVRPRFVVESRRTSGIQVEGTVSSTECLELAAFWTSRYFLGGPRLFSLGVGVSNLLADQLGAFPCTGVDDDDEADDEFTGLNYFVDADLRQPWPGSPRTALLLSGYVVRETAPRVYVRRGYGGEVGVAREFRPELLGSAVYAPSRNELSAADIFFCGTYGVCEPDALDELTDFTWLSPVQLFGIWTPEGPPAQVRRPEPGERRRRWVRAGLEGAAFLTGSEYDYVRALPEGAITRFFGERGEVAVHTRAGVLAGEDELPPQVRLFSGGVNTVRGVPQNLLGPKILVASPGNALALGCTPAAGCPGGLAVDPDLVAARPTGGELLFEANLEARHWLTDSLQVAAFADLGVIGRDPWGREDDALVSSNWAALLTPGVGIRILTGLGPIRIDLAYDPSGDETVPLLTRDPDTGDIVVLGDVRWAPHTWDDPGLLTEIRRRLQLQVAIGQPF